jgi:hypothetical protein
MLAGNDGELYYCCPSQISDASGMLRDAECFPGRLGQCRSSWERDATTEGKRESGRGRAGEREREREREGEREREKPVGTHGHPIETRRVSTSEALTTCDGAVSQGVALDRCCRTCMNAR